MEVEEEEVGQEVGVAEGGAIIKDMLSTSLDRYLCYV